MAWPDISKSHLHPRADSRLWTGLQVLRQGSLDDCLIQGLTLLQLVDCSAVGKIAPPEDSCYIGWPA